MRTIQHNSFYTVLVASLLIAGCSQVKPVAPVASVSERLAKVWTASKVVEGAATVYTKGGAGSNAKPNYDKFRLDLTSPSTVKYTEFDGNTFTGTWSATDTRLVLTGLLPIPTGTGGLIEFTIGPLTDTQLELTRLTVSDKTGGTINKYTLSNP